MAKNHDDDNDLLRKGMLPKDPGTGTTTMPKPSLPIKPPGASKAARVLRLADVEPESVSWLWEGRIPLGKITVFDGDPGLGKSTMLADLAARLSTGRPFPEESTAPAPASVLFIAHEDGVADTLRPRLDAAGADTNRVHVLEGFPEDSGPLRLPSIPADLEGIERVIREIGIRLIVVDPLYAYLNAGTDAYSDHNVRSALAPLATVAERTGAAVVLVRHLRKAGGASALYRGGGSIGIIGIARSGLLLAKDPDDESGRVLACVKSNLGPPPPSLLWRFAGGTPPRLDWTGQSKYSADALVNVQPEDEEGRSAIDEASELLTQLTASGPIRVGEAKKEARKAGISDRTLERAKARLGLRARRQEFAGEYVWERASAHARPVSKGASMDGDGSAEARNQANSEGTGHAGHVRHPLARQDAVAGMAEGAPVDAEPDGEAVL